MNKGLTLSFCLVASEALALGGSRGGSHGHSSMPDGAIVLLIIFAVLIKVFRRLIGD